MSKLISDIKVSAAWLVNAFTLFNIHLDYSIASIKHIDGLINEQFVNGKPKPNGLFEENIGGKIFALGAYVGETLIRNCKGAEWDKDSDDEVNIAIIAANGWKVFPMQKTIARIKEGEENNLYNYVSILCQHYLKKGINKKPFWKFWDR